MEPMGTGRANFGARVDNAGTALTVSTGFSLRRDTGLLKEVSPGAGVAAITATITDIAWTTPGFGMVAITDMPLTVLAVLLPVDGAIDTSSGLSGVLDAHSTRYYPFSTLLVV